MDDRKAIREAQQTLEGIDPAFKPLLCDSDNDLASLIRAGSPAEPEPIITDPGPLTATERGELDGALAFNQIFGGSVEDTTLRASVTPEAAQMAGLTPKQKTLSPELQRAAEKFANSFVDRFITRVTSGVSTAKSASGELRKTSGGKTIPIAPKLFKQFLAERAREDSDCDPALVSFLEAHAKGDETGMRASARQFAAELA
jgi:hypothetical protein